MNTVTVVDVVIDKEECRGPDRAISVAAADPLTGFYVNSMSASTPWWSVWGTRMARVMRTVAVRETST